MSKLEELQEQIEQERARLDELLEQGDFDAYYPQNVLLDRLIEQYIELSESEEEVLV